VIAGGAVASATPPAGIGRSRSYPCKLKSNLESEIRAERKPLYLGALGLPAIETTGKRVEEPEAEEVKDENQKRGPKQER
jgi:hypothetical protein